MWLNEAQVSVRSDSGEVGDVLRKSSWAVQSRDIEQLGNTSTTVASTATIPCARYTMGKVPNHQKQQDSFARLASYPHKPRGFIAIKIDAAEH